VVLILIGGVLMALGALLPWEKASAQFAGSTLALGNVNGTSEGAGPIVLVLGIVIVVLAALVLNNTIGNKAGIATLVISAIAVVFCFGNWSAIQSDIDKAKALAGGAVDASIGIGLVMAVIGCLLVGVTSLLVLMGARKTPSLPAGSVVPQAVGVPTAAGIPEGWYHDPLGRHPDRWWDGATWTQWVRDKPGGTRSEDPLA
jgi:hypothetical protein